MISFFDSHAHLDDEKFNEDRNEIIPQILEENNSPFVTVGYSLQTTKTSIELSHKYPIYATAAISPNDIPKTQEELNVELNELKQIIQNELNTSKEQKLVAIGEIGLDYYWETENKELQKQAFIEQINIANEFNLPITIHSREAINDTIEILKAHPVNNKGIFHCCPFNKYLVEEGLKMGFYISFAGPVTFKNSKNANEIINLVPLDKILIETDSPYLSPEPKRGKRNDPRNVKYIAQKIADVKELSLEEVANQTYINAKTIYKIK